MHSKRKDNKIIVLRLSSQDGQKTHEKGKIILFFISGNFNCHDNTIAILQSYTKKQEEALS